MNTLHDTPIAEETGHDAALDIASNEAGQPDTSVPPTPTVSPAEEDVPPYVDSQIAEMNRRAFGDR